MAGLIITNGDSAADLLRAAGRRETIVPWRDVLHEGPISATDLNASSWMRVTYLADRFGLPEAEIAAEFAARDGLMRRHGDFSTIELWFEHDLYDQLQLLQILAFFAGESRSDGVSLVQANDFLGRQTAGTILRFAPGSRPINAGDLDLARTVWTELAASTPQPIAERVAHGARRPCHSCCRHCGASCRSCRRATGLGRTEQTILDGIGEGIGDAKGLFARTIASEQAAFMGDWSFFRLLDDLAGAEAPLIAGLTPRGDSDVDAHRYGEAELALTMAGEDVREGGEDRVQLSGLDRWWAGTSLLGRTVWRYDRDAQRLVSPYEIGA